MASTSSRAPSQDQTPSPPRQAFISHASADDGYVAELESFLRAAGLADVFNDAASIQPDDAFWPAIQRGIADSELIVCVISAASSASDWVRREVEHARSLGRRVIGLRIDDSPLPPHFAAVDVVNFRVGRASERHIDIGRILQYAPEHLVGRDAELSVPSPTPGSAPCALTPAGRTCSPSSRMGGEGKTSLVAKWAVDELSANGWPGCEAAFAWSFYSQGTRDQVAASSDAFLKAALDFFAQDDADRAFAASPAGAYEKGQRLARRVGSRRSLLILDGLEPLQYAPTAPTAQPVERPGPRCAAQGAGAAEPGAVSGHHAVFAAGLEGLPAEHGAGA
jgi:hypothetical protein